MSIEGCAHGPTSAGFGPGCQLCSTEDYAALEADPLLRAELAALRAQAEQARETLIDPQPFQQGRRRALETILERIDRLPEDLLTRTMDEGRGVSHARDLLRPYVQRLLEDPTWLPDLERA